MLKKPRLLGLLVSILFASQSMAAESPSLGGARSARWNGRYMEQEQRVLALGAHIEASSALAVLRTLRGSTETRLRALALAVLYEHGARLGVDETERTRIRGELKTIAEDVHAPAYARDHACRVLLTSPWSGRDSWYETLLMDVTLRGVRDGNGLHSPLRWPLEREPRQWVPRLIPLLKREGSLRSNVAHVFAGLLAKAPRDQPMLRDVALALLPWLLDRDWAEDVAYSPSPRAGYIASLAHIDLKEAIPGLIRVVEIEQGHVAARAAGALEHYRDPRALPALRKAAGEHLGGGWEREAFLRAIEACGGVSATESAKALEGYVRMAATPEGLAKMRRAEVDAKILIDPQLARGMFLAHHENDNDAVVKAVIELVLALRVGEPEVSRALEAPLFAWRAAAARRYVVSRLADERLDDVLLRRALEQRRPLATDCADSLRTLVRHGGFAAGRAVAILADRAMVERTLSGSDNHAIVGLLKAAIASDHREMDPSQDRGISSSTASGSVLLPTALIGPLLANSEVSVAAASRAWLTREGGPAAVAWLKTNGRLSPSPASATTHRYRIGGVSLGMTRNQVKALPGTGAAGHARIEYSSDERVISVSGSGLQDGEQEVVGHAATAADVRRLLGRADQESSGHVVHVVGGFFWRYHRGRSVIVFAFTDDTFELGLGAPLHEVSIYDEVSFGKRLR